MHLCLRPCVLSDSPGYQLYDRMLRANNPNIPEDRCNVSFASSFVALCCLLLHLYPAVLNGHYFAAATELQKSYLFVSPW